MVLPMHPIASVGPPPDRPSLGHSLNGCYAFPTTLDAFSLADGDLFDVAHAPLVYALPSIVAFVIIGPSSAFSLVKLERKSPRCHRIYVSPRSLIRRVPERDFYRKERRETAL